MVSVEKATYRTVLQNRNFRLLWTNQILLQLSFNMINFALILRVWQATESNTATALVIAAFVLPALFFGVFAGLFADTFDRRKIILATAIGLALIFFSFSLVKDIVWLLLLLALMMSSINQFFMPAEAAIIPMLVKKKELIVAQSLFSMGMYTTFLIGYAIAGPVMKLFGNDAPFYLATTAVIIGMIFVSQLPSLSFEKKERDGESLVEKTKREVQAGIDFIFKNRFVSVPIGLLTILQMVVGIIAALTPGFMVRVLSVSEMDASLIVMFPTGLGMVVGAVFVGRLTGFAARRIVVARAIMLAGIALLLITLSPLVIRMLFIIVPLLFLLAMLLGAAAVNIQVISMTVLQEQTPMELKGRIFATLNMAVSGVALIPVVLTAGAADIIGLIPVLSAVGVFIIGIGIVANQMGFVRERVLMTP